MTLEQDALVKIQALSKFAERVLRSPKSTRYKRLSAFTPLGSVIECAHQAKVIGEGEFRALLKVLASVTMNTGNDFSLFVSPEDTLVGSRKEVKKIPPGAFIAFMHVDKAVIRGKRRLGRRHLIHAMISLGEGRAVCVNAPQIGVATHNEDLYVIDLYKDVQWIKKNNGYDLVQRIPIPIKKSQLLRIRWRIPGFGRWGYPIPSVALREKILDAVETGMVGLRLEEGNGNKNKPPSEHVFRVNFQFKLDNEDFEAFFNSPDEMRGHYYTDAASGESYVRELLKAIADRIDWEKQLKNLNVGPIFGQKVDTKSGRKVIIPLIKSSVTAGKVWYIEDEVDAVKRSLVESADWEEDAPVPRYVANKRWKPDLASYDQNWQGFLSETKADRTGVLEPKALTELEKKFNDSFVGVAHAEWGASYRYCRSVAPSEDLSKIRQENTDVKGDWVQPDGSIAGFTPNGKHFRGHQIKWFGFT